MRILFKIYPQDSHFNATFPLARKLREEGCEIIYAGYEERRAGVEAQGFRFHVEEKDLLPKLIAPAFGAGKDPAQFGIFRRAWAMLRYAWKWSELEMIPKDGFDQLVRETAPDAILVDSPYARFATALFKHRLPFGIVESMTRLDRRPGVPPLCSVFVPSASLRSRLWCWMLWRWYSVRTYILGLAGMSPLPPRKEINAVLQATGQTHVRIDYQRYFHIGITNVPEFILSPKEFDFPGDPKPYQIHVGPSVDLRRKETGFDFRYRERIQPFVTARTGGKPLVYCSLGTASWRYRGIEQFFGRLIEAARDQDFSVVIAIGQELDPRTYQPLPANVLILQRVPQIQMIQQSDLVITHGGMNTVAECILLKTPMLVYPGSSELDQPGNAARIVYHGIGLSGSLAKETSPTMRSKLLTLLGDPTYRTKVARLSDSIVQSRAYTEGASLVLSSLFPAHAHN